MPTDHRVKNTSTCTVSPLTSTDVDEAARLYLEVFLADEPTTQRIAPNPITFLPDALVYIRSLAEGNLSFIARDEETKHITGFIFCFDLLDDPASEGGPMAALSKHFRDAVEMIDELEERYINRAGIRRGSVLHIYQIGVARTFRGNGISTTLIWQVLTRAREQGYRQIIADCTSRSSRRSFEGCGFFEAGSLAYNAFCRNGVAVFDGLEGGISLMTREI